MDDVDAVQAQIARNMLLSGDWVTARLNDIPYMEKAPLIYWMTAISFRIFGVHDWAARLPLALSVILLCWLTFQFAAWGLDVVAGLIAGLALATCIGLFLFTRILIPDAILTLTVSLAVWAALRLLDPDERPGQLWPWLLGASLGLGLLVKGLIAAVFPLAAVLLYMASTRQLLSRQAWSRLHVPLAASIAVIIAPPWHILATLRNPPYFAFTLQSGPGQYHGFFWFYFLNEHLLRFLNLRYPRDYNTVPRLWFWLLNLVWLFPWSFFLPAAARLDFSAVTRAGRTRRMALCWAAVVMLFFTFSTTQEYYSMPIYPALALLIGSALSAGSAQVRRARRLLAVAFAALSLTLFALLLAVLRLPARGDISQALTQNPDLYTLSLGHLRDLTLPAFAYLKAPLALTAAAFAIGAAGICLARARLRPLLLAVSLAMVVFCQAARLALVRFDNYLGSYPLAQALEHSPPGLLIEANAYYAFSSVFFYTGRTALLWNGRVNNLEYGSYAPGTPARFIGNDELARLWNGPGRCYLLTYPSELALLEKLSGRDRIYVVAGNSGNYLLTNQRLP